MRPREFQARPYAHYISMAGKTATADAERIQWFLA